MAKKTNNGQGHDMYVGLQQPVELRRNVLLGTKQAIVFLKKYENLKEITQEKDAAFMKLLSTMKELNTLVNRFKSFFPKSRIPDLGHHSQKKAKEHVPEKKIVSPQEAMAITGMKKPHHVTQLEEDLSKIEAKLAGL